MFCVVLSIHDTPKEYEVTPSTVANISPLVGITNSHTAVSFNHNSNVSVLK